MSVLDRTEEVVCETCNGTGKEICNNPDHKFLGAIAFTDTGRIGCPCCGHDEDHAIPNTICLDCNGTGRAFIVNDEILQLAELGEQVRWISVSEKLPLTKGNVLVYDGYNIYESFYSARVGFVARHPKQPITHYMPLPQPPVENDRPELKEGLNNGKI